MIIPAMMKASTVWYTSAKAGHRIEFVSFAIVPITATHGTYISTKAMNAKPVSGVKTPWLTSASPRLAAVPHS